MTTPPITATAPPPALGTTLAIEAERRLQEREEQAERFTRADVHLPRPIMGTKGRPVPAAEYGVMAPAPGQRLRLAVAHRTEDMLAEAAPAMRRLRMFQLG
jgi:hypothetical protein